MDREPLKGERVVIITAGGAEQVGTYTGDAFRLGDDAHAIELRALPGNCLCPIAWRSLDYLST